MKSLGRLQSREVTPEVCTLTDDWLQCEEQTAGGAVAARASHWEEVWSAVMVESSKVVIRNEDKRIIGRGTSQVESMHLVAYWIWHQVQCRKW